MSPPSPVLTEDGHVLTDKLLRETREELARADGKAQILFAVSGVVIGVVLGGLLAGDWRPADLSCLGEAVWWLGVVAAAVGPGALAAGIWPRLVPAAPGRVTYFEDVRGHETCDSLILHLNLEATRRNRDVEQLWRLSKIVHRKYVAVKIAVGALVSAAGLCVMASLIG